LSKITIKDLMKLLCCLPFDITRNNQKKKDTAVHVGCSKMAPQPRMFEKEALRLSTIQVEEQPCTCGIYKHPRGSLLLFFILHPHLEDSKNVSNCSMFSSASLLSPKMTPDVVMVSTELLFF